MPIQVTCPSCKAAFKASDAAAGKQAKCPKCNGLIDIPATVPAEEVFDAEEVSPAFDANEYEVEPPQSAPTDEARKPCPMCGEMIQKDAVKCRFCGEVFDELLAKAERKRGPGAVYGESVEEAAKRLIAEKHDKTTAIQIFVTSLIGCFSPIIAIYGIVFLLRRPYSFPYKGLAVAGTIIHCVWALLQIVVIMLGQIQQ